MLNFSQFLVLFLFITRISQPQIQRPTRYESKISFVKADLEFLFNYHQITAQKSTHFYHKNHEFYF